MNTKRSKPNNPKQSALIFINYNSAFLLLAALRSLLEQQSSQLSHHLIIIDNGSTDDSIAFIHQNIEASIKNASERFHHYQLIRLEQNHGFAAAVNHGLAVVDEPYAFILNTDIRFHNRATDVLIQALEKNPLAVLATPKLIRPNGKEQIAAAPLPTFFSEIGSRSLIRRRFIHTLDSRKNSPVPSVVGPCMLVHMKRIEEIGFLDERFFFYFEETDWCKRIEEMKRQILYVPQAEIQHEVGASAKKNPYRSRVQFYYARYQYFHKYQPLPILLLLAVILELKISVNLLMYTLLMIILGWRQAIRRRFFLYATLWIWHLFLCRPRWGLQRTHRKTLHGSGSDPAAKITRPDSAQHPR